MSMRSKTLVVWSTVFFFLGTLSVGMGNQPLVSSWQEGEQVSTSEETSGNGRAGPNRLIHEKSPYLIQHADNPVDWYPWGEEAFQKARDENRPIFLSIGYSTCHWCHVMERESFAVPEIAAIMNRHFVNIKIDREERPDVDQIYMTFVQASTGSGGWPMSVFVTPELKPFYGGTYFQPQVFSNLLERIAEEWDNNQEAISQSAANVIDQLKNMALARPSGDDRISEELLDLTYQWHQSSFDPTEGGFGDAPKFPRPVSFNFLLRYHRRKAQLEALEMSELTLRKMAYGGIHDHIGGGFHRYSTDDHWFLPHFEKMLYDQAQLAIAYLDVYQISADPLFEQVARRIFQYVLRDMTGENGGFFSAEDADSSVSHENLEEHVEGAFYVWAHSELLESLEDDAGLFNAYYGVKEQGNVTEDRFGEFTGKNHLSIVSTVQQVAERLNRSSDEVEAALEQGRRQLLEIRSLKPRPGLDDKILTDWNGLMISALARGYQVLQEKVYLEAAEKAATLIAEQLYDAEAGVLKRRLRGGEAAIDGLIGDYAFFVQGLLDLYESSLEGRWLLLAMDLTEIQNRLFWDADNGGFFTTSGKDPSILVRMKNDYDGAEPSPNSVAVLNLLRLSQMSGNQEWAKMAEQTLQFFQSRLKASPPSMPQMMVAVDFYLGKPKQILIAGERDSPDTQAILREVHKRFLPGKIVVLADGGAVQERLAPGLEILETLSRLDGKATAYICENYVCQLPTNDVAVVARLLDE
ncbi:MAG: thioredoxin domain-containing protein [Acidobacteriota bacterium]